MNIKSPKYNREGVSQARRLLPALNPANLPIEGRTTEELLAFLYHLAAEIVFYDHTNHPNGDWQAFFPAPEDLSVFLKKLDNIRNLEPHLAVLLTFIHLYKLAQSDLNQLTGKHLQFFYQEVLRLNRRPARPDKVHLVFQLAKPFTEFQLEAGTQVQGKDNQGRKCFYALEEDTVLNQGRIASVKALYVRPFAENDPHPPPDYDPGYQLYASPVADSADGVGAPIEQENTGWRTFGVPEFHPDEQDQLHPDRPYAITGFALSSPAFLLSSGDRAVTVTLFFKEPLDTVLTNEALADAFIIEWSGEASWISPDNQKMDGSPLPEPGVVRDGDHSIVITQILSIDQAAIVPYNPDILTDPFQTPWPVMRLLLNPVAAIEHQFIYTYLKGLSLEKVELEVQVEKMTDLHLENDEGVLDASKPFYPFGLQPVKGARFYVDSEELRQKKLEALALQVQWQDLPETDFATYYVNYPDPIVEPPETYRTNSSFKSDVFLLHGKQWKKEKEKTPLFTNTSGEGIPDGDPLPDMQTISKIVVLGEGAQAQATQERSAQDFSNLYLPGMLTGSRKTMKRLLEHGSLLPASFQDISGAQLTKGRSGDEYKGFLKIQLLDKDFGHSDYPTVMAKAALSGNAANVPNPPYTPIIAQCRLDYQAVEARSWNRGSQGDVAETVRFYHLYPFGVQEAPAQGGCPPLVPSFKTSANDGEEQELSGALYLGVVGLEPGQILSLLFQVEEDSSNPDREKETIFWSYLNHHQWRPFPPNKIIKDTTQGLLNSGIIRLALPLDASTEHTLMPAGLHWIRAAVRAHPDAVCNPIAVRMQAALAVYVDQGANPGHLLEALPPGSLQQLKFRKAAVEKVEQPYASFEGWQEEDDLPFYRRVSERLRHKNRAITIWDYERLVLENFPSIYKAKCLNHTFFSGKATTGGSYQELAPGHVTIVTVANVRNKNAQDPLRPKAGLATLSQIEAFLQPVKPGGVQLHVKNPFYEEIKLKFQVRFKASNIAYFRDELEREIKCFLSPWSCGEGADIELGGRIHKSAIINFVEERPYVDYVNCFQLFHIVPGNASAYPPDKDREEAVASTPVSVLVSADQHEIIPLDKDGCVCDFETPSNFSKTHEAIT